MLSENKLDVVGAGSVIQGVTGESPKREILWPLLNTWTQLLVQEVSQMQAFGGWETTCQCSFKNFFCFLAPP